jgi:hypothetical protein
VLAAGGAAHLQRTLGYPQRLGRAFKIATFLPHRNINRSFDHFCGDFPK